jgi:hypothetical protein
MLPPDQERAFLPTEGGFVGRKIAAFGWKIVTPLLLKGNIYPATGSLSEGHL